MPDVDSTRRSTWLPWPESGKEEQTKLYCFHHAGGGASAFRRWKLAADDWALMPVQLPGREERYRDPPIAHMKSLIDRLATDVVPRFVPPFAFVGHSMGALVAFELARLLHKCSAPAPRLLVVVACKAPPRMSEADPMHGLADTQLVDEVNRRFGGIPRAVLASSELLRLWLPALRADLTLVETYEYKSEPPLDCPILALGGDRDEHVPEADLFAWREQTRGKFTKRLLPGGHFFPFECGGAIAAEIRLQLFGPVSAGTT